MEKLPQGGADLQRDENESNTVAGESDAMILTKAWLRADKTTRFHFLSDIRAGMPNLWRAIEAEFSGIGGRQ